MRTDEQSTLSPRHSLRWRLPLLISALIAAVLITFLVVAYRTVEAALVRAGGERAQGAADQVASLLDVQRSVEELQRVAGDADLGRYLQSRTEEAREAARKRLASLASGRRRIEVWDDAGSRVLELSGAGSDAGSPRTVPPPGTRPSTLGVSPLRVFEDMVYTETVTEIRGEHSPTERTTPPTRLGYLVSRSTLSINPPGILGRLVGRDAVVAVGNQMDDIWTDFSRAVPAPQVDRTRTGIAQYTASNGDIQLGAVSHIPGTPWAAWVGFPRGIVVAPAQRFLSDMIVIALIIVGSGAILARTLAAHITKPLSELGRAAASIATGDFSGRVRADRHDELGQLAHAFNSMTAQVDEAHQRLESRVLERTAELAAARSEADRANRAKSEFLSLMSHDLRTPLNAILGFAQLLEIADLKEDHADSVQQILSGGRHLLDLISEVLDITRLESGQLSLSPEPVSVRDVVQRAVELVKPLAAQRGISLNVESFSADAGVFADRQRLTQVLLNLLSNAVKYNKTGGRVTIEGKPVPHDRYRIAVTDTGAGISESNIALLFQPFERLGAEQTPVEGTGLGLALARALAGAMGGTLDVDSVLDRGSTFWVELVAAEHHAEPTAVARAIEVVPDEPPPHKGVILYIEDNVSNVRLMERILRQRPGLELLHAPNGDAGLAVMCSRRPDLILLDLHLPDMSGEDVLRRQWADPTIRQIPTVVVTADATPGLFRRLKAAGATACLTKPLNVREVVQLVDSVLNHTTLGDRTAAAEDRLIISR